MGQVIVNLPYGAVAQQPWSWLFTIVGAMFFLASAAWVVRESRRHQTAVPVLALTGGLVAALEEPWINTLIQLWYPQDSPLVVFTVMDHAQPLYVYLVYPGFVGIGAYLVYRSLVHHPDGRHLWWFFVGIVLLDMAFELPTTAVGVFYYYGAQPMQPIANAWPLWVGPINAAGPVLAGALMYRVRRLAKGAPRAASFVLFPPLAYAGVYGAAGWPVDMLLKSEVPSVVRWAGAAVTVALCVTIVALIRLAANRGCSLSQWGDVTAGNAPITEVR
ncbi:hypothetical protein [Mycobacterium sp.]|uniref:hypothetical protein n=1 Tax=Mycobacterium sp. TaxID=1785 RepID=UPI003C70C918